MRRLLLAGLLASCPAAALGAEGSLKVITYNIAGLPAILSHGKPDRNTRQIATRLDAYDLAFLQEDFHYDGALHPGEDFPYRVAPRRHGLLDFGDGLSILSRSPLRSVTRVAWNRCHGVLDGKSDCLTPKGFSLAELTLGGAVVDVYDLHADAGRSPGDASARQAQMEQLVAFMKTRPADRAVIVGGDLNMRLTDEAEFQTLLNGAGLTDSCRVMMCADQGRLDRILYRDGARLRLAATAWRVARTDFLDAAGEPLSDHDPVAVRLDWIER